MNDNGDERPRPGRRAGERTTLKDLARELGLSATTISVVLNRTSAAAAIPKETQERVFAAARALDYQPNLTARALRSQRSQLIGVLVPEISEGYAAAVLSGVEASLAARGYFTLIGCHCSGPERITMYMDLLLAYQAAGLILVNTPVTSALPIPAVSVAGHEPMEGVTNVVLDHLEAARQAIAHLVGLGHERIAVFRGHPGSLDSRARWQAIVTAAQELGVRIPQELTVRLTGGAGESAHAMRGRPFSPQEGYEEGYAAGKELLERGVDFTALFAFNDVSAIGATRAFVDAGRSVPGEVSVVGFDDIQSAAFQNPSLTTIRQPLRKMGELAGEALVQRISSVDRAPEEITVASELIVRASSAPVSDATQDPDDSLSGPSSGPSAERRQ